MFVPGLSTAGAVSNVSGRGFGMDVVRSEIERVGGRVEVSSTLGEGTTFTIRVPLTLAIIDAMLVRVGASVYALPLLAVRESLAITNEKTIVQPDGGELIRLRERVYPTLDLREVYGQGAQAPSEERAIALLVEDGGGRACLKVDEILGQRQIVVKSIDGYLENVFGISGCSILASGAICLILDLAELVNGNPKSRRVQASA